MKSHFALFFLILLLDQATRASDQRDYTVALAATTARVSDVIACPQQGGWIFFQNGKKMAQEALVPSTPYCRLECSTDPNLPDYHKAVGAPLQLAWVENLDSGDLIHINDPLILSLMCQTSSYETGVNPSVDQVRAAVGGFLTFLVSPAI